ncbi:MAG: MBL fold metallo-hydrolase [Pseudomonadota bacterium]
MAEPRQRVLYGVAETVAPQVRRVTCRNPSPMTHMGTQTYLVGRGDVVLIDPGPDDVGHRLALLSALKPGERIRSILVTHSHRDHSRGVSAMVAETGAEVLAFGPHGAGMRPGMARLAAEGLDLGGGEGADRSFRPDRCLSDGEAIGHGGLVALHTPGHLSNHLAFSLEDVGIVFTGDAVMGWATTLVSPPEGDMAAQIETLGRLARRRDRLFLPGHGPGVRDPATLVRQHLAHRQARERQILSALNHGPGSPGDLAARVYTDIDPALLPAAARNVFATLLGLLDRDGVACEGPVSAEASFRRL